MTKTTKNLIAADNPKKNLDIGVSDKALKEPTETEKALQLLEEDVKQRESLCLAEVEAAFAKYNCELSGQMVLVPGIPPQLKWGIMAKSNRKSRL